MCDGRRAGVVGAFLLAVAGSGHAQTVAEFRQRLDKVSQYSRHVSDTLRTLYQFRANVFRLDTIRAGALVVLVAPSAVERTRPAVDSVWQALSSRFGAGATVVGQAPIVIQFADQPEGEIPLDESPAGPLYVPTHTGTNELTDHLMGWVSPVVFRSVDGRLQEWVPHPYAFTSRGAARTLLRNNRATLYAELATAPWHMARTCFRGTIGDCRLALGITGTDPVLDWLDAADRRHYVEASLRYLPVPRARYDRCSGGDDEECIALIRLAPSLRPAPPLSVTARLLLLALALDAGGPNAFPRLLEHPDRSMDARLEAASGVPVDSLVAQWRRDVLATHPKTVAADARAAWGAVFWGVLFTIAALRSTRWR